MFYICYLYLFTYTCVQHDLHVKWWSRRLTVTRRVSRVEQKLLTLPKHMCSPLVLSGVRGARSLVVCVVVCKSLFVLLSLFCCPLCCLFFFIYGFWLPLWYLQTLQHNKSLWNLLYWHCLSFFYSNATPKPICLLSASIMQFYYIVWWYLFDLLVI